MTVDVCCNCVALSAVLVRFVFLVFLLLFVLSVGRVVAASPLGFAFTAAAAAVTVCLFPLPFPLLLHFLLLEANIQV